jgi:putative exosortase-associated protein (TIGR04073 family)
MKRFHSFVVVGAMAACCVFLQTSALADGPVDKLKRGLAGIMFGGVEVPATVCEESRNQGWPWGVSIGFFKAVGNFAAREVTGVFEFITAPIPWPDEQYKPYMDTAYPWDRFHTTKDAPVVPPPPTIPQSSASTTPQSPPPTTPQSPPAAK